jgi:hypothetical protein
MKTRIIAIVALALAGCAAGPEDEPDLKPDEAAAGGEEALEPPSGTWDARDPGLAPPDDPALPF